MKNKVSPLLARATALALLSAPLCSLQAQEVFSATIGAVAMEVPAASDALVALPFNLEKKAGGNVASASGAVATLGASSLEAGAFDADGYPTHFLFVEDGDLKGRIFDIVSNDATTLTLDAEDLTGLAGSNVSVRAHWTLGTLFPDGVGGKEELEPGLREVEVVVPVLASEGGGIAAERVFYFYDGAWREVGRALEQSVDNVVVKPATSFVLRNNGSSVLDYFFFGEVEFGPLAVPVVSSAAATVDNFATVTRPLGLTIAELGLDGSGAFGPEDRLLVFPAGPGKNKIPDVYFFDGVWKLEGGDGSDVGSTVLETGQAVAVRKAAGSDSTEYWVNEWDLAQ